MSNNIKIIRGDITEQKVNAIVNAANTELILGAGVAGAIRIKGGEIIQDECFRIGRIELGEAVLTTGGDLWAEYVIHAAVMHFGDSPTDLSIKDATRNSLRLAVDNDIQSIAFPALGTGVGGFPFEAAAGIMISTTLDFLNHSAIKPEVRFVLFDEKGRQTFQKVMEQLSD